MGAQGGIVMGAVQGGRLRLAAGSETQSDNAAKHREYAWWLLWGTGRVTVTDLRSGTEKS